MPGMRLWSLHPRYLDRQGLLAVWREGLLARKVLRGETKGYRHHPQLIRFKAHPHPARAIEVYLWEVAQEAKKRGYHFRWEKIGVRPLGVKMIQVTTGQVEYEQSHLKKKLEQRDICFARAVSGQIETHPLFSAVPGEIEPWEKT